LWQEDLKFETSLDYIVRPCHKTATTKKKPKMVEMSWALVLTPVILTTQEAEIRRIVA
jgi:hypothetical protein